MSGGTLSNELVGFDDVMQALVAALMLGEDAGLAALEEDAPGVIHPGSGTQVRMSPRAIDLLRQAQRLVSAQAYEVLPDNPVPTVDTIDLRGLLV